jgi:hypothetical protein
MPVTYLDVPPGLSIEAKQKLVRALYDALHAAYPFPDDVRIFLREWPTECVSQDGQLGAEPARPVLHLHVPINADHEARRSMLAALHSAMTEAYHLPKFMVFFQEYPLDRVALDGRLHADNAKRVEAQRDVYGD